jgi:hypothetical protein
MHASSTMCICVPVVQQEVLADQIPNFWCPNVLTKYQNLKRCSQEPYPACGSRAYVACSRSERNTAGTCALSVCLLQPTADLVQARSLCFFALAQSYVIASLLVTLSPCAPMLCQPVIFGLLQERYCAANDRTPCKVPVGSNRVALHLVTCSVPFYPLLRFPTRS